MSDWPRPVLKAMMSADFARKWEASKIIIVTPPSWSHSKAIVIENSSFLNRGSRALYGRLRGQQVSVAL
jgi:hypothetical protein